MTHTMSVVEIPAGLETDYLAVCSCGWEDLETSDRLLARVARCAVQEAEEDGRRRRARRVQRDLERLAAFGGSIVRRA